LAKKIPKEAEILAKKFWPGPLTLVLFKKKIVPDVVTAGTNTVALRMPKNKIALELIKLSGVPISAPSANLAGRPSPTTAEHVFEDFGEKVDLILDAGKTKIGVESTVLDLTVRPPQILRPGGISFEKLKKILKDLRLHPSLLAKKFKGKAKSPGMKYRHYAPRAELILARRENEKMIVEIKKLIRQYKKLGKKVGVMATSETKNEYKKADFVFSLGSRKNLKKVAKNLFKALREFDKKRVDVILAENFPKKEIGLAIMHRLQKAAGRYEKIQ
jgi:L-threonylcarbamoyladenylate synthase